MSVLIERLKATWFGPLAGTVALAFIIAVPAVHECGGVSAVRGGQGGILCSQLTPLWGSSPQAVAVAALAAMLLVALPLVSSRPGYVVGAGVLTALCWLAVMLFALPDYRVTYWLAVHHLEVLPNELATELLAMLAAALLPIIAGARRLWMARQ